MKKTILILLISFLCVSVNAQTWGSLFNLGGPNSMAQPAGGIRFPNGAIWGTFIDTTTANSTQAKNFEGAWIDVQGDFHRRTSGKWVKKTGLSYWGLSGSAGTNPAINFIGTSDNQPLQFRINNTNSGTLSTANIAMGYQSLPTPSGIYLTAFGNSAMGAVTVSSNAAYSSAFGYGALGAYTIGIYNTAVGYGSLGTYPGNAGYGNNTSIGALSGTALNYGRENTLLGAGSGNALVGGNGNTFIGYRAGRNITASATVAIGQYAGPPDLDGSLSIQNIIYGTGNNAADGTISTGNIGIGTKTPAYKLDVAGDINVTGNFKVNGVNLSLTGGTPIDTVKKLISDSIAVNSKTVVFNPNDFDYRAGTPNDSIDMDATLKSTLIAKLGPTSNGSGLTGLTKTQVGLGNVDNTSDVTKNAAVATLTNKTLTSPVINTPTGIVKGDVGLGNVDNTSDATKNTATATLTNKTLTSPVINSPTGIVKGDVGLGNVDNTSDVNKPISTATQTALNLKAPLTGVGEAREWIIALGDETTDITTGTSKVTFRVPYAVTITGLRVSINTASSSGIPTFDIKENGVSIMTTTKLTIDATEKTSVTAAVAAVITDTVLADDSEITFDITVAGTGAKGPKLIMYYTKN